MTQASSMGALKKGEARKLVKRRSKCTNVKNVLKYGRALRCSFIQHGPVLPLPEPGEKSDSDCALLRFAVLGSV